MLSIFKSIVFIFTVLIGSFVILAFGGMMAMYAAALTGIGAFFTFLKPTLLILFWAVMARIYIKTVHRARKRE